MRAYVRVYVCVWQERTALIRLRATTAKSHFSRPIRSFTSGSLTFTHTRVSLVTSTSSSASDLMHICLRLSLSLQTQVSARRRAPTLPCPFLPLSLNDPQHQFLLCPCHGEAKARHSSPCAPDPSARNSRRRSQVMWVRQTPDAAFVCVTRKHDPHPSGFLIGSWSLRRRHPLASSRPTTCRMT